MYFKPEFFAAIKNSSKKTIINDIIAGIIVGIVAIPLSIALAIASGASPKEGLITAAIAGFTASLLGGSRVQITGPTGAFVVIVYGIIAEYGMSGLIASTIMAGIILILFGVFKMGSLIKFIPYPIVSGFTSGIAIVILSGQVKDLLGLRMDSVPSEFIDKCIEYTKYIGTVNCYAVLIAAAAVAVIVISPKINKYLPGSLLAILITTAIVMIFKLPVDTIGSRYPELTGSIPKPSLPMLSFRDYLGLVRPAFTIALLGSIESLLSAVVADKMIGEKHNSDMELIGQGCANILSGLFGGLPATGAIARTAANVNNGGRTPIAGMVHAVFVLLVSVLLLPYAKLIPMSALAAILLMVCYNMFEWNEFKRIKKVPKSDTILMLLTFVLTVVFDLIVAIEIGMIIAAILFIKRISEESRTKYVSAKVHNSVSLYNFSGPLFFGNVELITVIEESLAEEVKYIVLDMSNVNSIDLTALDALKEFIQKADNSNRTVYLTGLQRQPYKSIKKFKLDEMRPCVIIHRTENALRELMQKTSI